MGSIGGPCPNARRGAIEVDAGLLKLTLAAPLPGPSQWEPKLLSQSARGAQSGVLRVLFGDHGRIQTRGVLHLHALTVPFASRLLHCSPLAPASGTRLQAWGPTRALPLGIPWTRGFSTASEQVSGSGGFRGQEFVSLSLSAFAGLQGGRLATLSPSANLFAPSAPSLSGLRFLCFCSTLQNF